MDNNKQLLNNDSDSPVEGGKTGKFNSNQTTTKQAMERLSDKNLPPNPSRVNSERESKYKPVFKKSPKS